MSRTDKGYEGGKGAGEGACLRLLIGIFVISAYLVHDYTILNIGCDIVLPQMLVALPAWRVAGIAIGLVYRPALTSAHRKV
jgi:hypothetical protein